jgi:putative ABC transport system ATP-binding protein
MLHLQKLLPAYFSDQPASLSDIWQHDVTIAQGELAYIVAPSGSGKTSLMHFIYGLRRQYQGNISFAGKRIDGFSVEETARYRSQKVSLVFQDLRLFPEQTILENIEIKRQLAPYHPQSTIQAMAERLGIGHRLHIPAGICSYGEQQRAAIIRALMQPFELLLLDEPFSHLDQKNRAKAMALILEEAANRKASLILADLEASAEFPSTRIFHL